MDAGEACLASGHEVVGAGSLRTDSIFCDPWVVTDAQCCCKSGRQQLGVMCDRAHSATRLYHLSWCCVHGQSLQHLSTVGVRVFYCQPL